MKRTTQEETYLRSDGRNINDENAIVSTSGAGA